MSNMQNILVRNGSSSQNSKASKEKLVQSKEPYNLKKIRIKPKSRSKVTRTTIKRSKSPEKADSDFLKN